MWVHGTGYDYGVEACASNRAYVECAWADWLGGEDCWDGGGEMSKRALKGPSSAQYEECDKVVSQSIPPLGLHIMLTHLVRENQLEVEGYIKLFFNAPERVQIKKVRWVK